MRAGSAALLSVLALEACNRDCPSGRVPEYDTCVRLRPASNGGASSDAGQDVTQGSGGTLGAGSAGTEGGGMAGTDATTPDAPVCGADQVPFESGCIQRDLFVDSNDGDDKNTGSDSLHALKSFGRAMAVVKADQIVHFEGSFGETTGDDFTQPIPADVALQGLHDFSVRVSFTAKDRGSTLFFAGSGSLTDITLNKFHVAVGAVEGKQTLKGVEILDTTGGIQVSRKAEMICEECYLRGDPEKQLISVEESAKLTWTTGTVSVDSTNCPDTGVQLPNAILVQGAGKLDATGLSVGGKFYMGIKLDNTGEVNLQDTTVEAGCMSYGIFTVFSQSPTPRARLKVNNSKFYGSVHINDRGIDARNTWFYGRQGLSLWGPRYGIDDLGTEDDAGNNVFTDPPGSQLSPLEKQEVGLYVGGPGTGPDAGRTEVDVIQARGNRWMPNTQDSDGNGTYQPGYVIRAEKGRNVEAESSEVRVGRVNGATQPLE